jgi:hypothetical protein
VNVQEEAVRLAEEQLVETETRVGSGAVGEASSHNHVPSWNGGAGAARVSRVGLT